MSYHDLPPRMSDLFRSYEDFPPHLIECFIISFDFPIFFSGFKILFSKILPLFHINLFWCFYHCRFSLPSLSFDPGISENNFLTNHYFICINTTSVINLPHKLFCCSTLFSHLLHRCGRSLLTHFDHHMSPSSSTMADDLVAKMSKQLKLTEEESEGSRHL